MPEKNQPIDHGDEIISWTVPEFEKRERSKQWYVGVSVLSILVLIYSFFTGNFLFAVIIVLAATVIIMNDAREPDLVKFTITDEGVVIGGKFIDYDELKDFSIIYKPRTGIKQLYFEFKNVIRPRLSIYLDDMNPLKIRDILLQYLKEDLERENEPLSESLARLFKI